jgi:hypothetical protein
MNYDDGGTGGLIIAGSYVPKTTAQLKALRERRKLKLHTVELDVAKMTHSTEEMDASVERAIIEATEEIKKGKDVLIMTSRKLLVGHNAISSLQIGSVIAAALVRVVQNINVRPRYIIAKVQSPSLSFVFQHLADIGILGRHHFIGCCDQRLEYETSFGSGPGSSRCAALEV